MKTVLIVDSSRVARQVARTIFENLQFTTSQAPDGAQALEACTKQLPDLVFLEWNLPVVSGLEFLKRLRSAPGGTEPKVIFATSENSLEVIQTALAAGANEFIMKPFDEDAIAAKLGQVGLL